MGAEWLTEEVRGGKGNGSSSQQARRHRGGAARAKELRRHRAGDSGKEMQLTAGPQTSSAVKLGQTPSVIVGKSSGHEMFSVVGRSQRAPHRTASAWHAPSLHTTVTRSWEVLSLFRFLYS